MSGAKKPDRKSLQKTCFIYTINLGHVDDKLKLKDEAGKKEALRAHHEQLCAFPNVEIVRAQIERNSAGELHVNGGVKLSKVIRARTLENKLGGYFDPALNADAVMQYGRKQETRVELLPNKGTLKQNKSKVTNPKQEAIQMLLDGLDPMEICLKAPEVYFTHHRAIMETWKMLAAAKARGKIRASDVPLLGEKTEEE